jgi:hypothetical protein
MADTDVAEMATSTPLLSPHPLPVEENNLSPQLMEPDVLPRVAVTAEVRAGQRVVQFVVLEHVFPFEPAVVASQ